jgi:protein CpxP
MKERVMKAIQGMFGKAGMRVALLGLCTGVLGVVPMMAQDTSAPPPPTQDGSAPPPMQGGGGGRGRGGPGRMQERQLEMMTKQLNLTPDQVTQVKAIDADTDSKMKALRDDTSTAPADKRPKMMAIRQESMVKIRGILTDEQKTKMDAMMAKMRERREEGGPPPPPQG